MGEQEFLQEIVKLLAEGVLVDRSEKPIRPVVTLVASARNKEVEDTAADFVEELHKRYPLAKLVVANKSPAEKAASFTAASLGMPVEVIEAGKKDDWDAGAGIQDERCVGRSTHVVLLDSSARAQNYRKLATTTRKFIQEIGANQ
jgi:hypothetical protein